MTPRCPNGNHKGPIQDFTEVCLACGHNIHKTDAEHERELDAELARQSRGATAERIADKERRVSQGTQGAEPCKHRNVQDFTETCLDCGKNIYE